MPEKIVLAYEAYINNLLVYNCAAGGIGKPYSRRCGIPQGCPFSMTMVALIMRSWMLEMRTHAGISCYILAEDVLIIGTGMKMVSKFAKAVNATHLYLHKMGAKVAPGKSYNFASSNKARRWFKNTLWKHIDCSIEVIADFRYLGAHLTTRQATSSSTLGKRWEKAKQQLRRSRYCPTIPEAKAKGHPRKSLCRGHLRSGSGECYSKENQEYCCCSHRRLQEQKQQSQCQPVLLHNNQEQNDLDPDAQIFARRVMQIRRTACKKAIAERGSRTS